MTEPEDPTRHESLNTAPKASPARRDEGAKSAGEYIGGYRIVGRLGEGGMGLVYEAEQALPRRRVALKIVRGGAFADPTHALLLEREAQALARLRHAGIAAVYEAGRTDDGLGFFAMELVQGPTLSAYLETQSPKLSPAEVRRRLQLFRRIADAVHYAHLRGVIHCDLKPSNIVVTSETVAEGKLPETKILDFGLARVIDAEARDASRTTELGVLSGTLAYMSPEQTRGNPDEIDLRADVYALGVVLYEMLTGERPYRLSGLSLHEALAVIVSELPRPLRQAYPGAGTLDPDIATIVHTALEKDPTRRYASAAALSGDIECFLTSRPISSRPSTVGYRLRRFVQRNRILVGSGVAIFLTLAGGVAVSTRFGLREAEQRQIAERARDDLGTVAAFQAEMLQRVDPEVAGREMLRSLRARLEESAQRQQGASAATASELAALDRTLSALNSTDLARDILDHNILQPAAEAVTENFAQRPAIETRLRESLGRTYLNLGSFDQAEGQAKRLLELLDQGASEDPQTKVAALRLGGRVAERLGKFDEAKSRFERAASAAGVFGQESPEALAVRTDLASLAWRAGRYDEAEAIATPTLATCEKVLGPDSLTTLDVLNVSATLALSRGRFEEAARAYSRVLETHRRVLGPDRRETVGVMNNLAVVYWRMKRYSNAETLLTEAIEVHRRQLGEDHPTTLNALGTLALVYSDQGRHADAAALHRRILELRQRSLGEAHPSTLRSMNNLAVALTGLKSYEEAAAIFARLIAMYVQLQLQNDPGFAIAIHSRGELNIARRNWSAARADLERACAVYAKLGHANLEQAKMQLADVVSKLER